MIRKFHIGKVNNRKTLFFRKPSEIGCYSVDGVSERNFHDDNHQMKWICKPPSGWDAGLSPGLDWDLNAGYAQAILKNLVEKKRMRNKLKWILCHQEKIDCAFFSPKLNE